LEVEKVFGANQKADTQLGQAVISNYLFIQRGNEKWLLERRMDL